MKINILIILLFAVSFFPSCNGCGSDVQINDDTLSEQPLNLSVFLDLSDRIADKSLMPNQMCRDTVIINYLIDYFRSKTSGFNIFTSKNKMRILFYPVPQDANIYDLSKHLVVDISKENGVGKRDALDAMHEKFPELIAKIYHKALASNKWPGCDIWDFFRCKKVDNLCIEHGARNILVILTDGFIFHENNLLQEGCCSYSYIVPKLLESKQEISLIDKRKGELANKGLEVLVLEINPKKTSHKYKMIQILENWFKSMGIEKISIVETDANLTSTQTYIKNFLNE